MQDLTYEQLEQEDDTTLSEIAHANLTADHDIGELYRSIILSQPIPEPDVILRLPGGPEKPPPNHLVNAALQYLRKKEDELREWCETSDYCEKIKKLDDKKTEVELIKGLGEFLSTVFLGIPVVSVAWYAVKERLMDKYICRCHEQA